MTPAVLPRRPRAWKACLLVALAAGGCRPPPPATPTATSARAPWLVTIVVDQLAAWIAEERWPQLPPAGGFARLRREGLWVKQLRYAHACTDTAPGHAALYTGATPRESGILANEVLGPDGRAASILGKPPSLAALDVETLADALLRAHPDARVMAFSLKDRGALLAAGRRPSLAMWLDSERGAFVTTDALAPTLPAWAAALAGAAAVEQARAAPWTPLDAAWVAARAGTADDQPGEGDYGGLGVTFPHLAPTAKIARATPAGDRLVLALARAAAAAAWREGRERPLLLALSLSSNDYVSHVFGPHSWEAWDELARLDQGLAGLLDELDRLVGPDGYAVMLAADHGSNPLPELSGAAAPWCRAGAAPDKWQRACSAGKRLQPDEIRRALEDAATRALTPAAAAAVPGVWIAGVADSFVYLTARARALPPPERARLIAAAATVLRERFAVTELVDLRALPTTCPPLADESTAALVCRSGRPQGPGDLYVVPGPGTFFDPGFTPGRGTSHGSPYLYDRAVPLLVRAPGRVPAGVVREEPTEFPVFVRTAAALLGIVPPPTAGPAPPLVSGP